MQQKGGHLLLIILYVDDLLIIAGLVVGLRDSKSNMRNDFSMKYLGLLRLFIGLEMIQKASGIMISQSIYVGYFLKRFHMTDCKATPFPFLSGIILEEGSSAPLVDSTLYRKVISSLLYLTHLRPDLSYAVSAVARFM